MQKAIGVAGLVVGVLLIGWRHNMSQSIGSQVKEAFTGSPTDKAMYFYIGGAVLSIFGAFRIFGRENSRVGFQPSREHDSSRGRVLVQPCAIHCAAGSRS